MRVIIAGDFCPQYRVAERFEERDFGPVLGEMRDVILAADYSIVNFECPITSGDEVEIIKCGPNLQCSERGIEAVKWVGFECVTLANNHFLDYGKEGVKHTLEICEKYCIDTVGGGMNICEASKILYKEVDGKVLAIINCCEHEFSIATETAAGSNPLNPMRQYYAILEAKQFADYVLVIAHGGHEYHQLPSPRMQETYRFFIDVGADVVINHHQHCFSGFETYKGKPIFYGLGNFCFDKLGNKPMGWCEGYMVSIEFLNNKISYRIIPYENCLKTPSVRLLPEDAFSNKIEELNMIIADDKLLREKTSQYFDESMKSVAYMLEPIQNRYIVALQRRGVFPSFWSKKWLIRMQNYVMCEAHRDKLEHFFKYYK